MERIFRMSVGLHGGSALEDVVYVDTTVQEKSQGQPRIEATQNLAGVLMRELRRQLPQYCLFECYQRDFLLYEGVLRQQQNDKKQDLLIARAAGVLCRSGKRPQKYEYASQASIASTAKGNLIVGIISHEQNLHGSHTLPEILGHVEVSHGKAAKQAVCDLGYREVNGTQIILPGKALKKDNRYQKDVKRKQCRIAAIEPIIGHLKSDYRMARNYLKGAIGDYINLLMIAATWNLKQWLLAIFWFFFPWRKLQTSQIL